MHVIGVAYKRDVDDMRESPALDIIELLKRRGAVVTYTDPFVPGAAPRPRRSHLDRASTQAVAGGADCAVIVTDHADLRLPGDRPAVPAGRRHPQRAQGPANADRVSALDRLDFDSPMAKTALITGITGQDGSYLAELLLSKGYKVVGAVRRLSAPNQWRIAHLADQITLRPADLLDQLSLVKVIDEAQPDEVYNLAAMSFVPASWDQPMLTGEFNAQGVTRVLEAIRLVNPKIKFYQASSSEMYGKVREVPQSELTPFYPRSPYGVSKVFGHYITVNYRESYGLYACSGILFNHESPRRGLEFVTRKVTDGVARIKCGLTDTLFLGNLDAKRDWGFSGDYVRAMWLMMQQEQPDDYVVATGETHTVQRLVELAFSHAGLDWTQHVKVDQRFIRPAEVDLLIGDPTRARQELGWSPEVSFEQLIAMMVDADVARHREHPGATVG